MKMKSGLQDTSRDDIHGEGKLLMFYTVENLLCNALLINKSTQISVLQLDLYIVLSPFLYR